jgi:hypothetical protein
MPRPARAARTIRLGADTPKASAPMRPHPGPPP